MLLIVLIIKYILNIPILFCKVDLEPRHEAFWLIGGINPPDNSRKSREKFDWIKHLADKPINRAAQYLGMPALALRSQLPLEPILPYSEATNSTYDVPLYTFDPRVIGFNNFHRHGTNIPGNISPFVSYLLNIIFTIIWC